MHQAIVAVGSNFEAEANFQRAEAILTADGYFRGKGENITTEPVGYVDCDSFLNGAFWLETDLDFDTFNAYLKSIEQQLGRVKGRKGRGPQPMDLDIVVWDGAIVRDEFYTQDYTRRPVEDAIARFGLPCQTS